MAETNDVVLFPSVLDCLDGHLCSCGLVTYSVGANSVTGISQGSSYRFRLALIRG